MAKMIEVRVAGRTREFTYRHRGRLVTIVRQGRVDPENPEVAEALAKGYLVEITKPDKKEAKDAPV